MDYMRHEGKYTISQLRFSFAYSLSKPGPYFWVAKWPSSLQTSQFSLLFFSSSTLPHLTHGHTCLDIATQCLVHLWLLQSLFSYCPICQCRPSSQCLPNYQGWVFIIIQQPQDLHKTSNHRNWRGRWEEAWRDPFLTLVSRFWGSLSDQKEAFEREEQR